MAAVMFSRALLVVLIGHNVAQRITSPCPDFLHVDDANHPPGVWGGVWQVRLPNGTIGVFLEMKLDQKINLITNNFDVTTTTDNQRFLIENFEFEPQDGYLEVKFEIKANPANALPQFEYIYVNGRQVCGEVKSANGVEYTTIPFITINDYDM